MLNRKLMVLITLLALVVAGCGSSSGSTTTSGSKGKSLKDCTLTMIPKATDNPYFAATHSGMIDAQKELGGTLSYVGPANGSDVTGQIQRIQSASQQQVCGIAVVALDSSAVAPALDAAAKRGAKVISWDSDVLQASRPIFVNMATAKSLGDTQFDIMAKALNNKGEFGIVSSQSTDTSKNLWLEEMNVRLKDPQYAGMKLVKTTYGDDDSKKSYDLAVSLIRAYPNLAGIMAPTPIALEASVKAAEDLGVQNKLVVTGLGNPGSDSQLIKDGKVPAYVLWSPRDLGYLAYYTLAALIKGEITGTPGQTFKAGRLGMKTIGDNGIIIMGPPITFTKANVDSYAKDFQAPS